MWSEWIKERQTSEQHTTHNVSEDRYDQSPPKQILQNAGMMMRMDPQVPAYYEAPAPKVRALCEEKMPLPLRFKIPQCYVAIVYWTCVFGSTP